MIASINPTQIGKIITKYKDQPSILKIKEHVKIEETFSFPKPTIFYKKATSKNDIPLQVLVATKYLATEYITGIYHHIIENQIFPVSVKKADVIPSHKQFENTDKANYRPVSLLSSISKIYERYVYTIYLDRRTSFTLSFRV